MGKFGRWMAGSVPAAIWCWIELVLGAFVFSMAIWQRFHYWLYRDDGTPTKRVAQTAGVMKASAAAFIVAGLCAPTEGEGRC